MLRVFEELMVAAAFAEEGVNGFLVSSVKKLKASLKSMAEPA